MSKFLKILSFFIEYITPVLVIAGVIFYLSAQVSLGSWIINPVEVVLRKGAHFTEYGLLAFFLWRLFHKGYSLSIKKAFWCTVILASTYAISDEIHQLFVAGRTGKFIDVIVDVTGIIVVVQWLVFLIKKSKKSITIAIVGLCFFITIVVIMCWHSYRALVYEENIGVNQNIEVGAEREIAVVEGVYNTNTDIISEDGEDVSVDGNSHKQEASIKDVLVEENISEKKDVIIEKLPLRAYIKVPFMVQSPFAKWDELHEEACEEASLIMLKYYGGKKILTKQVAEDEIQKLVKYQIEKYGDFYDTDVETTKKIGEDYFDMSNLRVVNDFEIVDLKKELAEGNIILIPTAGRELKNPYFTAPGPLYHNLVITGYDDTIDSKTGKPKNVFITNDPGTKRGENYKYNQQVLYDAIHDFTGDVNDILKGGKSALVLDKFSEF